MTDNSHAAFRNPTVHQRFLFSKADRKARKSAPAGEWADLPAMLSEAFPEVAVGKGFFDPSATPPPEWEAFAVMVISPDGMEKAPSETPMDFWFQVAEVLDRVCRRKNGVWCLVEDGIFGCMFPGGQQADDIEISLAIQEDLDPAWRGSVTIGIARHPTLDFPKDQVLENAKKALDHAAFFGPGSVVRFDAVSLNISGDQHYQRGDITGAIAEFKRALRLDPANVNVHNSLGVCYAVLGHFDKAAAAFITAARLDPQEAMAVYNMGMVHLLAEGDRRSAMEKFLEADRLCRSIFEVVFQIGKLYFEMGEAETAEPFLTRSIDLKPSSGVARRYMAECCHAMGLTEAAVSAYQKAVTLNPNDAEALSALGELMDQLGENPEIAVTFCRHSVEIAPQNGLFRHRLGRLYLRRNRPRQALEQFEAAQDLGYDTGALIPETRQLLAAEIGEASLETGSQRAGTLTRN